MNEFEFVFSLFGLVLGFSLVEVLAGLGKLMRSRRFLRLGWLTQLLALFVMLDITSFWAMAWRARDVLPVNTASLFGCFLISAIYYLAAMLIFPVKATQRSDLDSHYYKQKWKVFSAVLACNVLAYGGRAALIGSYNWRPWEWALVGAYLALITSAIAVKGVRSNTIVLMLLILLYAVDASLSIVMSPG